MTLLLGTLQQQVVVSKTRQVNVAYIELAIDDIIEDMAVDGSVVRQQSGCLYMKRKPNLKLRKF